MFRTAAVAVLLCALGGVAVSEAQDRKSTASDRLVVAQASLAKNQPKLEKFLKRTFNNSAAQLRQSAQNNAMDLYLGAATPVGRIQPDEEDYFLEIPLSASAAKDKAALESYVKQLFNTQAAQLKPTQDRSKFEIYVGQEFIGIARLQGPGSVIQIAILDSDLE